VNWRKAVDLVEVVVFSGSGGSDIDVTLEELSYDWAFAAHRVPPSPNGTLYFLQGQA
jgi:hypothetical protein